MKIISLVLAALCVGYANAATSFSFAANTDGTYTCSTYCIGFETSDPAHTVDYVNVQLSSNSPVAYKITLSVDGVSYQGISSGSGASFTAPGLLANVVWSTTRTCTHSGRGQSCYTRYHAVSGSLAL